MNNKFLEKWLRDAYAMEKSAIEIMERQMSKMNDYPEARERIQQHLEETRWQAGQVEDCLRKLGSEPSVMKDAMGRMSGTISALTNAMAEDETLKNFIASHAFENLEIASYRSLMTAADECGEQEVRAVCEQILAQEEAMAAWCAENIRPATRRFLARHQPAPRT